MELIKINPDQFGLSEIQATAIANKFLPILEEMQPHLDKYAEIKDLDPADPTNSKQFKELRLKLVKCRTNAAKIHKDEKAYYLAGGKYVDSYKNEQLKITEPIEADLAGKEKYAEIQEMKRKELLRAERAEKLRKWECEEANNPALGEIADSTFEIIIAGAELAYKNKIEAEKQAEIDRLKAEELAEQLRQEENIWALYYQRLSDKEQSEFEASERIRLAELAQKQAEQEKEDAKYLAEYNIWQEYENCQISQQKKADRLMFENKAEQYLYDNGFDLINGLYQSKKYGFSLNPLLYNNLLSNSDFINFQTQMKLLNNKAESEAQQKIKEAADKAEADRKAEIERLAKEKRIAEEKAAKAPDIDKLAAYVKALRDISIPDIKNPDLKALLPRFFVAMKTAISIIDIAK